VLWYTWRDRRRALDSSKTGANGSADGHESHAHDEHAPLLRRSSVDVPGSRRRSSAHSHGASLPAIDERRARRRWPAWAANLAAVLGLCALGSGGWAAAYAVGAWQPDSTDISAPPGRAGEADDSAAVALGYVSAACYLGARLPQIAKNARDRSCAGLSLLFFVLSVTGNATYGAQILCHSTRRAYVLTNLPWLIGSLGEFSPFLGIKGWID